ncbi:MAG TPA: SCP2 sterol-binding domain-containing protein [Pseudolabrys sp.]|nr:SCP2 sterol-binding domain-containing protein [Pseudolabrys sp.]
MLSAAPTLPPLLSLAIQPLPLLPLQPLLALLVQRIKHNHPEIFERLGAHAGQRFGIDPSDLPFAFLLEPDRIRPRLAAVRSLPADIDVRIRGPLASLIGLVDGEIDGDALFFSRELVIEGDMEAALALRNAIDDAQIDMLGEVLGPYRQWSAPVRRRLLDLLRARDASGRETIRNRSWN